MSNMQTYNWIAASATSISALTTTSGAGSIPLNGSLAASTDNGQFVNLYGLARVVTLTSANNLSAVNVTINGYRDGAAVTETRVGPNANTVATTALFSQITSITVDAATSAMSVGTGQTGQTQWFKFNNQASVANLAIQVVVTGTISYSFQVTLDSPTNANTAAPAVFAPNVFTPVTAMTAGTTTLLANYTAPIKYCNIIVNSSTTNATLTIKMLQQAIT